jgi:SAM-dependent methyltransferase
MNKIIYDTDKDPLGVMLLDYFNGNIDAYVEVDSTTLEMSTMRGETMFRTYSDMDEMEHQALRLCAGKILDVGAGSGCHSLYLQNEGKDVHPIDISPGCVEVMKKQNINNVSHQNMFSLDGQRYTTILMLMNGLGLCGSIDGLSMFIQYVRTILAPGGQVIADSTDLSSLYAGIEDKSVLGEKYFGETEFVMKCGRAVSDPFGWLYIDFDTLRRMVTFNDLRCEKIMTASGERYLVRIY